MIDLLDLKLVYFRTAPNMSLRELREFLKGVNAAKANRQLAGFCREKEGIYSRYSIREVAEKHVDIEFMTDKEMISVAIKILKGPKAAVLALPEYVRKHIKDKYDIAIGPSKNRRTQIDRLSDEIEAGKKWSRLNSVPLLAKPKKYAKMGVHNRSLRVDHAL